MVRWAMEHFVEQEIPILRPLIEVLTIRRGRRIVSPVPLFPGYLFVRVCDAISSTRGVRRILKGAGGQIAYLSERVVAHFQKHPVVEYKIVPRFRHGQIVRPMDGPFCGLPAEFEEQIDSANCRILVSMFGRPTFVEIELDQIEAFG
jgi:transcriptional antiterminator RfaH